MNLITKSLRRGAYLITALSLSTSVFAVQPPEYEAKSISPVIEQIESEFGPLVGIMDVSDKGWVFLSSISNPDSISPTLNSHIWDSENNNFIAKGLPEIIIDARGDFYSYAERETTIENHVFYVCKLENINYASETGEASHDPMCQVRNDNSLVGPIFKDLLAVNFSNHNVFNSSGWSYDFPNELITGAANRIKKSLISPAGEKYILPNQTRVAGEIGNCFTLSNFVLVEGGPPTIYLQQCVFDGTDENQVFTNQVKAYTPIESNPGNWIEQDYLIPDGSNLFWSRSDGKAVLSIGQFPPANGEKIELIYCDITQCSNTLSTITSQSSAAILSYNEGNYLAGNELAFDQATGMPRPNSELFIADSENPNNRRYLSSTLNIVDNTSNAVWLDLSESGQYGLVAKGQNIDIAAIFGEQSDLDKEFILIKQSNSCAPLTMTAPTISTTQAATGQTGSLVPCNNLIVNGSFENHGPLNRGNWGLFRNIEGWTSHKNRKPFEIQTNGVGGVAPYDGNAVLELDGNNNAQVIQKINTSPGQQYTLSLAYSPRVESGKHKKNTNRVDVFWDGKRIAKLNGNSRGWQQHNFTVTAASSNSRLVLKAKGRSDSYGGLVDNIRLVANLGEAQFTSSAPASQQAGIPFLYTTTLQGINEAPHYFLDTAPEGMQISTDGAISWENPTEGSYTITVRAIDGCGREAVQTFTLDVFLPSQCL